MRSLFIRSLFGISIDCPLQNQYNGPINDPGGFYEKDITFVTENEGGVVTVYVIGQKPTNDYTIQVTITEVDV